MAIHGVGIDIIEVMRVRRLVESAPARVHARMYTDHEWDYCHMFRDPYPALAARFAAKEACFKALRVASWRGFVWRDLEIHSGDGRIPSLCLHGGAADLARALGITRAHVSLSHLKEYATATVILECA